MAEYEKYVIWYIRLNIVFYDDDFMTDDRIVEYFHRFCRVKYGVDELDNVCPQYGDWLVNCSLGDWKYSAWKHTKNT